MVGRREVITSAGGAILAGVSTATGLLGSQRGNETYEFVVSPESEPSNYEELIDNLSELLEVEVVVGQESTTEHQVRKLKTGAAEFGETSTEVATTGHLRNDFYVVLNRRRFKQWNHASVLLTREDLDIEAVSDLKESSGKRKRIAFGGKFSAPASIYPLFMLYDGDVEIGELPGELKGMEFIPDFGKYRSGSTAFDKLDNNEVDAAGVARFAAAEPEEEYPDNILELERLGGNTDNDTVDIPNGPVICSPKLSEDVKDEFVDAFREAVSHVNSGANEADDSDDGLWFDAAQKISGDVYEDTVGNTADKIDHSYKHTEYNEIPEELFPGDRQSDSPTPTGPPVMTEQLGPKQDTTED